MTTSPGVAATAPASDPVATAVAPRPSASGTLPRPRRSESRYAQWQSAGLAATSWQRTATVAAAGIATILYVAANIAWPLLATVGNHVNAERQILATATSRRARVGLVQQRMRELDVVRTLGPSRTGRLLAYVETQRTALSLCRQAGVMFPSDDLVAAVTDALESQGEVNDALHILVSTTDEDAVIVRLTRFYILLRGGETSGEARTHAIEGA
jgi:hypothetical protein